MTEPPNLESRAMTLPRSGPVKVVALLTALGLLLPIGMTAQVVSEDSLVLIAHEIIDAAHFVALISLDADGHPQARVMDPFPPESDMTVWLATNPRSRKVEQIRKDNRVTLYYFDKSGLGTVTLMGTARLVDDPAEKAKRWKAGWEAFYPDRDSSYLLIEFRPVRMEIVSIKHGLSGDPQTWTPDRVEFHVD
jgi:general stress protein 26